MFIINMSQLQTNLWNFQSQSFLASLVELVASLNAIFRPKKSSRKAQTKKKEMMKVNVSIWEKVIWLKSTLLDEDSLFSLEERIKNEGSFESLHGRIRCNIVLHHFFNVKY